MTVNQKPIDLFLISGFLGSGKTTFLKRILSEYQDKPLGLLVNEFGQVGIDGTLLENDDLQMVELNNGSIFCACLKDGFVNALKAFTEQPIEMLFIENSGMGDPSSMNTLLKGLAPYLSRPYNYRGSLCVVDSPTFNKYVDIFMPVQRQIAASSLILINKTDLSDQQTIEQIKLKIKEFNPEALILNSHYADIPLEIFESKLFNNNYQNETTNTQRSRPAAFVLETAGHTYNPEQIEAFCQEIINDTWRIKGFFQGEDNLYQLQVSSGLVEIFAEAKGANQLSQIVIICQSNTILPRVKKAWQKHCQTEINIK